MAGFGSESCWFLSLYKKILRLAFLPTVFAVLLINIANVALVFAFFLPLKVLILAGSNELPAYMHGLVLGFEKSDYILSFAGLSVVFYVVHHCALLAANALVVSGAQCLINNAKKIAIFDNQEVFAENVYRKVCNTLSASSFFLAGSLLGVVLYPSLFLCFVLFSAFYIVLYFSALGKVQVFERRTKIASLAIDFYSGVGFFFSFGFVLHEYFNAEEFRIFGAIVGLLLIRQMIQRVCGLFGDSLFLVSNKPKINSIFYESLHIIKDASSRFDEFWELGAAENRDVWISDALRDFSGNDLSSIESRFVQLGIPNVAGFDVIAFDAHGVPSGRYLIKLYGVGKEAACKHEAVLLSSEWSKALPAPVMVGVSSVGGFHSVFYETQPLKAVDSLKSKLNWYSALSSLWGVEPGTDLVDQFSRSKPMLVDRLDGMMFSRLKTIVSQSHEIGLISSLQKEICRIRRLLSDVPLCVFNPDVHMGAVLESESNGLIVYNWGRWVIEPIGAGWPTAVQDLKVVEKYLLIAKGVRPELSLITSSHVALVAVLYAMESQYARQNYLSAIELIPAALSCLEQVASSA